PYTHEQANHAQDRRGRRHAHAWQLCLRRRQRQQLQRGGRRLGPRERRQLGRRHDEQQRVVDVHRLERLQRHEHPDDHQRRDLEQQQRGGGGKELGGRSRELAQRQRQRRVEQQGVLEQHRQLRQQRDEHGLLEPRQRVGGRRFDGRERERHAQQQRQRGLEQ